MKIPFTKMHGLGNDYVYVNCFDVDLSEIDVPALCRDISDRHHGVGSDGLILIAPPESGVDAHVRMIMYNADGSRGEMCGNGIRCVAKYAVERLDQRRDSHQSRDPQQSRDSHQSRDRKGAEGARTQTPADRNPVYSTTRATDQSRDRKGAVPAPPNREQATESHQSPINSAVIDPAESDSRNLRIQTDRGILELIAHLDDSGRVERVRVDMGTPILSPGDIPMRFDGDRCIAVPLEIAGHTFRVTCVSMGNPHAVAFVDDLDAIDLPHVGPLVERHAWFPNRVNFHLARVHDRGDSTMQTWERGSGITQACGTGACAVHVAGVLEDRLDRSSRLHLPGGDLDIDWPDNAGPVFMTGPATEVFDGEWEMRGVRE